MKLLLDVHFSPAVAAQLRRRGHDAVSAADDPQLRQVTDERLLECAVDSGRALLTNDAKDLLPIVAEWARSGREHLGLLLTSDRSMPRTHAGIGNLVATLDALLSQHPEPQALRNRVVWPAPEH